MDFHGVAFPHPRTSSYTTFLKTLVKAKSSGLLNILKQWLVVSKGMLPINTLSSKNIVTHVAV